MTTLTRLRNFAADRLVAALFVATSPVTIVVLTLRGDAQSLEAAAEIGRVVRRFARRPWLMPLPH